MIVHEQQLTWTVLTYKCLVYDSLIVIRSDTMQDGDYGISYCSIHDMLSVSLLIQLLLLSKHVDVLPAVLEILSLTSFSL